MVLRKYKFQSSSNVWQIKLKLTIAEIFIQEISADNLKHPIHIVYVFYKSTKISQKSYDTISLRRKFKRFFKYISYNIYIYFYMYQNILLL